MKPGWKTTEFWIAVLTVIGVIAETLPDWAAPVASAAYILSRGLAKKDTIQQMLDKEKK